MLMFAAASSAVGWRADWAKPSIRLENQHPSGEQALDSSEEHLRLVVLICSRITDPFLVHMPRR